MLNLTRRERNVIKFLVLLYIAGCIIFFGKNIFLKENHVSTERDSIVANFQEHVEKVDSIYFSEDDSVMIDNVDDLPSIIININTSSEQDLLKIKGIGLLQFITLLLESLLFRRTKRWWIQHAGEPFVSLTTRISSLGKKKTNDESSKTFDRKKAKELAEFLDAQKSSYQQKTP